MKVLVYGWYNHGNLGDDLFVDAFKRLFPTFEFVFTDYIKSEHLLNIDALFVGGGSLLGEEIRIEPKLTLDDLKKYKILYLGVGGETAIHATHKELLSVAKLIALRSYAGYDDIHRINPETIVVPDLVYNLNTSQAISKIPNSILVIPNISVIPKWDSPHWKHSSWDYFKIEFAQFLDEMIKKKFVVHFLPFCISDKWNDSYAAHEIISRMNNIEGKVILAKPLDIKAATYLMSQYRVVITQRYHGTVLAEMALTPCLTIHHHDKLKNSNGSRISYYGVSKNLLWNEVNDLLTAKVAPVLPIDRNIFTNLIQKVDYALCRNQT